MIDSATPCPAPLLSGTALGPYEIIGLLGNGHHGTVYRALDRESRTDVAIKTLNQLNFKDLIRFKAEAQTLAKLSHDNVIAFKRYVADSAIGPLLVLEYLPGVTLCQKIGQMVELKEALATDEAARIVLGIIAGMMAAHRQGIIHADLKPGNIFLAASAQGEQVKIIDFGLARDIRSGRNDPFGSRPKGTWGWMAPEQMNGHHDDLTDQYAIGAILFACLTSHIPFPHTHFITTDEAYQRVRRGEFTKPSAFRPDLSIELEEIVLRSMSPEPRDRFADLASMHAALEPFALSSSVSRTESAAAA
jgi:serine/threonine protein kinase